MPLLISSYTLALPTLPDGTFQISPVDPTLNTAYTFTIDVYYSATNPLAFTTIKDTSGQNQYFNLHIGCNQISNNGVVYKIVL